MNPQPDPMIGNIVATIIVLMVIYYTIKAIKENKSIVLNDKFVIGYIDTDPIVINEAHHHHKATKTVHTKTKKVVVKKPDFENQPLYTDCVDALVALGMKKKEAKNRAMSIFSTTKPQPKSIQEFLTLALKLP